MKLAVFDIDGTLVQYHRKRNDIAYIRALKETFGITIKDDWSAYAHSTDSGVLSEIFEKDLKRPCALQDIEKVKKSMASWLEKEYGNAPFGEMPGAKECLRGLLSGSDWTAAIATGNWEFAGRYKLQSAGFDPRNIPFASADDGKVREWILLAALTKATKALKGVTFEKVVYVGDWIWDIQAAKALGWGFIGIDSGGNEPALREAGAEHILPDFTGLQSLLDKI